MTNNTTLSQAVKTIQKTIHDVSPNKTPQEAPEEEMAFLRSVGVTIKKVQDFEEGLKIALSLK